MLGQSQQKPNVILIQLLRWKGKAVEPQDVILPNMELLQEAQDPVQKDQENIALYDRNKS